MAMYVLLCVRVSARVLVGALCLREVNHTNMGSAFVSWVGQGGADKGFTWMNTDMLVTPLDKCILTKHTCLCWLYRSATTRAVCTHTAGLRLGLGHPSNWDYCTYLEYISEWNAKAYSEILGCAKNVSQIAFNTFRDLTLMFCGNWWYKH